MNGLDLNIDNYSLINLLDLFKLDYNFTLNDLKQAKKIVLRTHPDKSNIICLLIQRFIHNSLI